MADSTKAAKYNTKPEGGRRGVKSSSSAAPFDKQFDEDDSLSHILRCHRDDGAKFMRPIWDRATNNQKFTKGDQWPDSDKDHAKKSPVKTPRLSVNEIRPILQTFSGRQMMQRFERAYMPRNSAAEREAEAMTAVDRAFMHAADAEQVESQAFKDGPGIQGISCVRTELDDLNERGGGLLLSDVPIWNVMYDPEARGINLYDRSWHRIGRWAPQSEIRTRWADKWATIKGTLAGGSSSWANKEPTQSSRIPWAGMDGNKKFDPQSSYYPRGKAFWLEFEEWKEIVQVWEVGRPVKQNQTYEDALAEAVTARANAAAAGQDPDEVPDTIESVEMTSDQLREHKDAYAARFDGFTVPDSSIAPKRKVSYKYAYIIGDTVLETGECPTGYWTLQFYTGFRFALPDRVEWQSLVDGLIDPQKWINVFISALTRNLQITPKGLLFVEEGFFRNRSDAMSAWGSPGGLVVVGRGKLSQGNPGYRFEAGGTQAYAGMVESLMGFWREALPRLAGFNPGALGQLGADLRRISGQVVRQVQDAAMTSNAEPFDALRHARREGGKIFLSFLRRWFTVKDVIRIVGDEVAYDTQPVMDPATGQPAVDPMTGQPAMKRTLVIPPPEAWRPDYWQDITVEDVVPTGDQLEAMWKSLETSIQILLQPMPDTGMPLFSSEDLVEVIPGLPAQIRGKMRTRIKGIMAAKMAAPQPAAQPNAPTAQPGGGVPSAQPSQPTAAVA